MKIIIDLFLKRLYLLVCVFYMCTCKSAGVFAQVTTSHQVYITHKGVQDEGEIKCSLYEIKNFNKLEDVFYTDVASVICGSNVCKVVTIKLFWDRYGEYKKFELHKGDFLEKENGILFTQSDYKALHSILKNKNSILKNYFKQQLVKKAALNAYDALSGATISLGNNEAVKGAVWTCYTLWHWVNGEMIYEIQKITAQQLKREDYCQILDCGTPFQQDFAVRFLSENEIFESQSFDAVLDATYHNNELFKNAVEYYKSSSYETYLEYLFKLYQNGNYRIKISALGELIKNKRNFESPYLLKYFEIHKQQPKYVELNMLLTVLESKYLYNKKIDEILIASLQNNDFLQARRIFWFFKNRGDRSYQSILKDFKYKNKGKL